MGGCLNVGLGLDEHAHPLYVALACRAVQGRDRVSTRGGISSNGTDEDMGDNFVMQSTPKSAEAPPRPEQ